MEFSQYMKLAIDEAKISLREGNNGFGAVIVKDGQIISYQQLFLLRDCYCMFEML